MVFDAPWSTELRSITLSVVALMIALPALAWFIGAKVRKHSRGRAILACVISGTVSALVLLISGVTAILEYRVVEGELLIERPLDVDRFDLERVTEVRADPRAMEGSIRTQGNGGLFSFSGEFHNRKHGVYTVFVTDKARTVVLRFDDGAVVVVSPGDPEAFVEAVKRGAGLYTAL